MLDELSKIRYTRFPLGTAVDRLEKDRKHARVG
jgi:hypothetical protein